jgi:hypothetical protein
MCAGVQDPRMGLSKTEMKRLLAAMPVDSKTNAIKYTKFKDIFTEGTVLLTEQLGSLKRDWAEYRRPPCADLLDVRVMFFCVCCSAFPDDPAECGYGAGVGRGEIPHGALQGTQSVDQRMFHISDSRVIETDVRLAL